MLTVSNLVLSGLMVVALSGAEENLKACLTEVDIAINKYTTTCIAAGEEMGFDTYDQEIAFRLVCIRSASQQAAPGINICVSTFLKEQ